MKSSVLKFSAEKEQKIKEETTQSFGASRRKWLWRRFERTARWLNSLEQFDIHPNQIQDWKKKLLSQAEEFFGNGAKDGGENGERETEKLHAKIGQLTMEKDFFPKRSVATDERVRRQMVQRALPVTRRCAAARGRAPIGVLPPEPSVGGRLGADASDRPSTPVLR